ncbi:MAG: AraC family transcriptional regulator [Ruminococcus sp.]|jgi:AraC-like DNA-binding protein
MLSTDGFYIEENNREILPVGKGDYPFVCRYSRKDSYFREDVPWHWHNALEISFVEEGETRFQSMENFEKLEPGDVIFVNSDVMHASTVSDDIGIYSFLFDVHFLSGLYNSLLERKYFLPILKCRDLQIIKIHPDNRRRLQMVNLIVQAIDTVKREPEGYEFEIRNLLSKFWYLLLEETKELRSKSGEQKDMDSDRIKIMMSYVQEHYMDRIAVEDIAAAANISKRECSRCFQRSIRMTPWNYLCDFRVQTAAWMLLRTNDTVTEISEKCGFSSDSYFVKAFRDSMKMTPGEYRKSRKKQ